MSDDASIDLPDLLEGFLLSYRHDMAGATFALESDVPWHAPRGRRMFARAHFVGARDLRLAPRRRLPPILRSTFAAREHVGAYVITKIEVERGRLTCAFSNLGRLHLAFDSYTIRTRIGTQIHDALYQDVETGEPCDMFDPFERLLEV
jgi:hypothetical protein